MFRTLIQPRAKILGSAALFLHFSLSNTNVLMLIYSVGQHFTPDVSNYATNIKMGTVALLEGWPACYRRAYLPLYALPLPPCFCTVPKRVPILGTFLTFLGPIGSLFILQGPYFQCFAKFKSVNSVCMYTPMIKLDLCSLRPSIALQNGLHTCSHWFCVTLFCFLPLLIC